MLDSFNILEDKVHVFCKIDFGSRYTKRLQVEVIGEIEKLEDIAQPSMQS